ncbi:MAG: flagellar hook-associated protein FlgK [Clostridiales bacterium]|nr:flagellar hook-associated protein FlgK [Clostridiales bacterium]
MVRPTFFGFETAKSAIYANQKSIDIVGHNLSNANTDGYTRQRVERASVYYSSSRNRIASSATGTAGAGVETLGVSQIRDSFIDKCYRDESSLSSYYQKSADILNDILDVFPEAAKITDDSGLIGAMEKIYESLNKFIQNPTLESEANIVKSAFANVVQVLHRADTELSTVAERQTTDLKTTVDRTNELLEQISYMNKIIVADATTASKTGSEYFGPNELLDKRNMMLDELSKYCNINVIPKENGAIDVEIGGKCVLNKDGVDAMTVSSDKNGYVKVAWRSSGENVSLASGSINAYIEVINGRGPNVRNNEETTTKGIPYYRDRLNIFAQHLANITNSSIPKADSNGNPLKDVNGNIIYKTFIAAKKADGTTDSTAQITAANISISDEWNQNGAGYFIFYKDENVEDYAQKLSVRLFEENNTFSAYGERFEGTFTQYVTDMVGLVGTDVSFNEGRYSAAASVTDSFLSKREEISGVQRDEETANMLVFQKSYQAAARVMTVMDNLLDTLINQVGASIS